ncbi:MAG: carbohydrate porin, partial [Planctomycetes bacterium]|nr:carbohydrate porin [Planctomycetota bacterium]
MKSSFVFTVRAMVWIQSAMLICFLAIPLDAKEGNESEGRISLDAPEDRLTKFEDLRSQWEERGFTFNLVTTAEFFCNTRGGIATHHARKYRGDVSLFLEYDTGRAGLWDGGVFFAHLQHEHGDGLTEKYVGDFQTFSNIEADDFTQVSEIWYRHEFLEGELWTKLGKQDASADFAAVEYGGEFISSSPGFSPTIPLVTYPDQDWGVVLGYEPNEH